MWTPKSFSIANFRHPVSKSWLRPWMMIMIMMMMIMMNMMTVLEIFMMQMID